MFDFGDAPPHDRDQARPLGASFANVTPLQVTREHDVRSVRDHLALVHVAQRPVVIPLTDEGLEATRGVVLVPFAPPERRMQKADVERAAHRCGVRAREIGGDRFGRKTLPMHAYAECRELERLGRMHGEVVHVVGILQMTRDLAFGVVVAAQEHHRDVGRS